MLTEQLTEAAETDCPKGALLCFHAPEVEWEYIFLSHGEDSVLPGRLTLEDAAGRVEFSAIP